MLCRIRQSRRCDHHRHPIAVVVVDVGVVASIDLPHHR